MREKSKSQKGKSNYKKKESFNKRFLDLDYKYKNKDERWFLVTLREDCNLFENYDLIQYEIESVFGSDAEYFLPIYVEKINNKYIGEELFDAYIFIKRTDKVTEELLTKKQSCLEGILKNGVVKSSCINDLKSQLKQRIKEKIPKKGDTVVALEGTFKNMKGKVLSVRRSMNIVRVEFKKKTRIVESVLSVINIMKIEDTK